MRRPLPLIAVVTATLLLLGGCAATGPAADEEASVREEAPARPTDRPVVNDIPIPQNFQRAIAQGTRTRTGQPGAGYWQQEATYDLAARVRPEEKMLDGSGTMTYTNNSPDTLRTVRMELAQNLHAEGAQRLEEVEVTGGMELQEVAYGGEVLSTTNSIRQPGYNVNGTQLIIVPPAPLLPGETAEVEIDWSLPIPQQGISGRMGYSRDNLLYIAYWYPIFSVYDDVEGWFTEPFLGSAEFYAGYADYTVSVTAPAAWTVMSTGRLQNAEEVLAPGVLRRMRQAHRSDEPVRVIGEEHFGTAATADAGADSLLTWEFEADDVRDVAFSATTESIWDAARTPVGDRDGDGETDYVNINAFWRQSAPLWSEMVEYEQHSITYHSEYTGLAYPWPHMTAVEGSGIIGGGMEFPMMTIMGPYTQRGDTALYAVTAHELAHMWVPMAVNTNERRFAWMDEGMTTFLENQSKEDYYDDDFELRDQEVYTSIARRNLEGEMMRESNWHVPGPAYVIASYYKPATLLTALRGVLGDETFQEAYRAFHDRWQFRHPYPYDFFNTFEDVTGRDLDWFWRSFYFETWTLDHAIARVESDGEETTIRIEDEGRAYMPARVVVTTEGGETLRRSVPVERWRRGYRQATITVNADSPVERVELDPQNLFPDVDPSDDVWTRAGGMASPGGR